MFQRASQKPEAVPQTQAASPWAIQHQASCSSTAFSQQDRGCMKQAIGEITAQLGSASKGQETPLKNQCKLQGTVCTVLN